jgi:hypothetical protein
MFNAIATRAGMQMMAGSILEQHTPEVWATPLGDLLRVANV